MSKMFSYMQEIYEKKIGGEYKLRIRLIIKATLKANKKIIEYNLNHSD
jgi:hypothetical protein